MNGKEPVLNWWQAGILLGLVLTAATALVKPLGVSTQYVLTDALVLHAIAPEWTEGNAYLAKYGEKAGWTIGYGWMVVVGMVLGGWLSSLLTGTRAPQRVPEMWQRSFGNSASLRYAAAFLGGIMLLFGARFGGCCTSGHMISGISQLAVSSIIFTVALFAGGITLARVLYRGDSP